MQRCYPQKKRWHSLLLYISARPPQVASPHSLTSLCAPPSPPPATSRYRHTLCRLLNKATTRTPRQPCWPCCSTMRFLTSGASNPSSQTWRAPTTTPMPSTHTTDRASTAFMPSPAQQTLLTWTFGRFANATPHPARPLPCRSPGRPPSAPERQEQPWVGAARPFTAPSPSPQ